MENTLDSNSNTSVCGFDSHLPYQGKSQKYMDRGLCCTFWNKPTSEMTKEELIIFIGYLDEQFHEFIEEEFEVDLISNA